MPAAAPRELTIQRPEGVRNALVWTPIVDAEPAPLMLAFHGAGTNALDMARFCGLPSFAAANGIIVALPNGSGRQPNALSWNAGPANIYAARHNIDDVGFVQQLLNRLEAEFAVDRRRIYAVGMSNGGLLCYRLAAAIPERLAAIAAVGCSAVTELALPAIPMPTIHIHGTDDALVPFQGGRGGASFTRTKFLPVRETIERWAINNGCRPMANTTRLADGTDETWAECHDYADLEDGKFRHAGHVRWVVIHGGGHTWPGHPTSHEFLGVTSNACDANRVIWQFLQCYCRDRGDR